MLWRPADPAPDLNLYVLYIWHLRCWLETVLRLQVYSAGASRLTPAID